MAYRNLEKRKAYINEYRAKKKANGLYGLCKSCNEPLGRNDKSKIDAEKYPTTGFCIKCHRGSNCSFYKGGYKNSDGYIVGYKGQLQHRIEMEAYLGRKLYANETVHHKNGVRDDNRIDNLELWVGAPWSGVRIKDAVKWAKEILEKYDV